MHVDYVHLLAFVGCVSLAAYLPPLSPHPILGSFEALHPLVSKIGVQVYSSRAYTILAI